MLSQEIIKNTRTLGLNSYEGKIWTSLLCKNIATAGELSNLANVPRSRCYDVLESLEKKGFIAAVLGKPLRYQAIPLKDVFAHAKKNIKQNARNQISNINNRSFLSILKRLEELHKNKADGIGNSNSVLLLKGVKNIAKHIQSLLKDHAGGAMFYLGNQIGQNIRQSDKEKNKKTKNSNLRFCAVSDSVVIFPISEDDIHPDYDIGLQIKNRQITKFLRQVFSG